MGPTASASGLLNLLLISILFFRQHKQDQSTQNLIHQALTKLERVESTDRELQTQAQLTANLQAQVNNVGKQLPTPQDCFNLHTAITSIDTVTSTLHHLQTKVESTALGLEAKIGSLAASVHSLEESVNSTPVSPSLNKIAVFVDAVNIEKSAKQKGLKPDYQKLEQELTKSAPEVLGLFYYTALEANAKPKAKGIANYQVISKPVVRYQNGKAKGNLDSEIIRDLMSKSSEFGTAILVSGDGDFTCIVEHLQQQHKKVIVVAFGDSTKSELRVKADEFIDLNNLSKVFDLISTAQFNSNSTPKTVTNTKQTTPKLISKSTYEPISNPVTKSNPIIKPHPRRAA